VPTPVTPTRVQSYQGKKPQQCLPPGGGFKINLRSLFEGFGLFPIIGEGFDAALCLGSVATGNFGDAKFDCLAIVPVGGNAARAAKYLDEAAAAGRAGRRALNLPFRSPVLRSEIEEMVRHFDEFGTPPPGVRQGIRAGGERGVFQNSEGILPRQADPRYYTEMDVRPGTGPRGAERLVIGKRGEVYYTPDHYRSFARLR
jgi:ribonuclease T1